MQNVPYVIRAIMQPSIVEITPRGVLTEDGEYELDILVYATGFDSVDGNYVKMDIRGRDGLQIKDN